ncbi:MAG: glycosyltransferase 87 family protein [Caldilineaceae bacterium]
MPALSGHLKVVTVGVRGWLRDWRNRHGDFLLLLILFGVFRLFSVWFLRPGGYTRDYSDLIYYQGRASWQAFELLPYRDYWSEYPPLFAWFTLWVDKLTRNIPLWEDQRLWYGALFGLCTVAAETVTFVALYTLARRLYGDKALRPLWLYAGLFLPVYMLGGWFDALPLATIFSALALAISWPTGVGMIVVGVLLGIGALLKLVPLALLAILPLVNRQWWKTLVAGGMALAVTAAGYGWAYLHGPVMTLASLRSLVDRSGWSTLYAWYSGYTRLGKVLGDVFDPTVNMTLYTPSYPSKLVWGGWLLLGLVLLIAARHRRSAPQSAQRVVTFAALTYGLLLLAYPAWNPQYALYLLPFLVLLWPNSRGLCYALTLTLLMLVEHPLYHNLIGPGYPPATEQLLTVDYRQLFWLIIVLRTALLGAITLDLALSLWVALRWRRLIPVVALLAMGVLLAATPRFAQAYKAGRLATSDVRPLALYLNTQETALPVLSQQLVLGRALRPFLVNPDRLQLIGGRPGSDATLAQLAAAGPFLFLHTQDDDADLVNQVAQAAPCAPPLHLAAWELWPCHGAAHEPLAQFDQGIMLAETTAPIIGWDGDRLYMTLFWQSSMPITTAYTVFVHVMDAQGALVGQWDQPPAAGVAPTTSWEANHLVPDDYNVPLSPGGSGPLTIYVGMYDPVSGARLPILQSADAVTDNRLHLFTIERP